MDVAPVAPAAIKAEPALPSVPLAKDATAAAPAPALPATPPAPVAVDPKKLAAAMAKVRSAAAAEDAALTAELVKRRADAMKASLPRVSPAAAAMAYAASSKTASSPAAARAAAPPPPRPTPAGAPPQDATATRACIELAQILNGYRREFGATVDYRFQAQYTADMGERYLKTELDTVRLVINSSSSEEFVKDFLKMAMTAVHKAHVRFGQAEAVERRVKLSVAFADALDHGFVDPEIKQIAVEYGAWFAVGPQMRLAGKLVNFYEQVIRKNGAVDDDAVAAANRQFADL